MSEAMKCRFDPILHDKPGLISISQIQQFMKCPKAWAFNYLEKITPRKERAYLTIGKLCHAAMAAAWNERYKEQRIGKCVPLAIFQAGIMAIGEEYEKYLENVEFLPEELSVFEGIKDDSIAIFINSLKRVNPERFIVIEAAPGIPMIEYHFIVPCPGSKGLHGYIDVVLGDKETEDIWAVDWKFRSQMSSDAEEPFNLQNAVYNYALSKMGIHVTGSLTWQHLNTAPAKPSLNKNNTMSRAKIRTTWEKYKYELEQAGLDPEDYREEMEPKLADMEWDKQTKEYRNDFTLNRIWKEIIVPVSWTIKSKHKKLTYSMFPWNCKICHFNPICLAEMRGYDVDFIKQEAYMPKPTYSYDDVGKNGIDTDADPVV